MHARDTCFDVTPDGFFDANMEACCGCGVCEAICPVKDCITMVNEVVFEERDSQWQMWQENKEDYDKYMDEKISVGKIEGRHPSPVSGRRSPASASRWDTTPKRPRSNLFKTSNRIIGAN